MSKNRSQWLELTDKQIALAMLAVDDPLQWGRLGPDNVPMLRKFARAIEAEVRSQGEPAISFDEWFDSYVERQSSTFNEYDAKVAEAAWIASRASPPSQPIASDVVAAPDALSQVPQDEFSGIARQRMQREFARTDHIVAGIARRRDETSGDPT